MRTNIAVLPRQQDKLVVFDDDPYFGALMSATARSFGFAPSYFSSLFEMGPFARIKDFDFAIIDVYMGSIRGDELAQYIDMFCEEVPVILVSGQDLHEADWESRWPKSVRSFIPKTDGPYKILEAARSTLQRDRLLRRLAVPSSAAGSGLVSAQDQVLPGSTAL